MLQLIRLYAFNINYNNLSCNESKQWYEYYNNFLTISRRFKYIEKTYFHSNMYIYIHVHEICFMLAL